MKRSTFLKSLFAVSVEPAAVNLIPEVAAAAPLAHDGYVFWVEGTAYRYFTHVGYSGPESNWLNPPSRVIHDLKLS